MTGRAIQSKVNAEIKRRGGAEKLIAGEGYQYFAGGTAAAWPTQSVYTFRISDYTAAEWLQEYEFLKAEYLKQESR